MNQFSWPVWVLALITMLAGAVVGDALRASADGGASSGGAVIIANTQIK
jgi:hypothetical protein